MQYNNATRPGRTFGRRHYTNETLDRFSRTATEVSFVGSLLFETTKTAVANAVDYGTDGHKIITVEDFEAMKAAVALVEKAVQKIEKSS